MKNVQKGMGPDTGEGPEAISPNTERYLQQANTPKSCTSSSGWCPQTLPLRPALASCAFLFFSY